MLDKPSLRQTDHDSNYTTSKIEATLDAAMTAGREWSVNFRASEAHLKWHHVTAFAQSTMWVAWIDTNVESVS
jgi:hypothetical protein